MFSSALLTVTVLATSEHEQMEGTGYLQSFSNSETRDHAVVRAHESIDAVNKVDSDLSEEDNAVRSATGAIQFVDVASDTDPQTKEA